MKKFLGLAIGLFSVIAFTSSAAAINIDVAEVQNGVTKRAPAAAAESVTADCPKIRKELERTIIYKVDGNGYFVYVNGIWHTLMIDQKQSVAYLAATCYSKGTVRILDARTGKLLARWGKYGYVTED